MIWPLSIQIDLINPLDVILSYLESSVDTPIASRCDVNRTSGTGDVSISDLLDQVS